MTLLLLAVGLLLASGTAALLAGRSPRAATGLGVGGAVLAGVIGLVPAVRGLTGAGWSLQLGWSVPGGSLAIGVDPLSALFLLPIFGLSALAAVYGGEYLLAFGNRRSLGPPWFFYNWLVAGMVIVVVARNAVLFLAAWEIMSLASYFLVTFENERDEVREAGWTYLVATHFGTAFLLALFVLLGRGSLDFAGFAPTASRGLLFLLAVIGFGTKAGFVPLHVWLPEAHPAAPSHVSAVMSGVMIKTGIYGLLRTLTYLGPPPAWWGWTMVTIGVTSGVLGVLFALAQHDLKRLLAYHSVENIGIIALGVGVGLLGLSAGAPVVAGLGFAGALLHVLNHALFKGLLFLGAGAVLHATGTLEMDRLGGLLKRMPRTAGPFLIGAAAIAGLPPLNGFVSEFLIYFGAIQHAGVHTLVVVGGLALIGGLAAACFAKAFGIVFLGEPREPGAAAAHDPGPAMGLPIAALAAGCLAVGLGAPMALRAAMPAVEQISGQTTHATFAEASRSLTMIVVCAAGFLAVVALLAGWRRLLLAGRTVTTVATWDCGYVRPCARMQYTASSFAQPITELFRPVLKTRSEIAARRGFFPDAAAFASHTPDVFRESLFRPLFTGIAQALRRLQWLQHGRLHLYVLYIAVTLVVLLMWRLT